MLRVTADTNIYISALQFGGLPLQLLKLATERRITLVISAAILEEVAEVLRDKFKRTDADVQEAMTQLLTTTETVEPTEPIRAIKEDPDDNIVLECAVAGDCHVIVSGDRHLLQIGTYCGIEIRKVAELLEQIRR